MPRDKKSKVSSRRPSGGTSSGHGHNNQEDQVQYSHDDGAAAPRSHHGAGFATESFEEPMNMDQENSSLEGFGANYASYGQGYAQQQQYPPEVQQSQWDEEPEDWRTASSAQPPASSAHRSHSSRDTSSRHSGRHGQHRDRHYGRESGTAAPPDLETINAMAEQQLTGGPAHFDATYTGEQNLADFPVSYEEGTAADAFGINGAGPPFYNPMQNGGPSVPQYHGLIAPIPYKVSADGESGLFYSSEFKVGRVLRRQWSEPQGAKNMGNRPFTDFQSVRGDDFFSKNRRFVILKSYRGHSVCAPILTYGNYACTKRGVHPEHHGIIYSDVPRMLPDEPKLGFDPVAMVPYDPTESLRIESRVNYSKRYTIEHNVYVTFVGEVIQEHMHVINSAI